MAFQNPMGPQPDPQRIVESFHTSADSFTEEFKKKVDCARMLEATRFNSLLP